MYINELETIFELGKYFLKNNEYDLAIRIFTRVVELDPKHVDAYDARGKAYGCTGKFDEAVIDFKVALEIDSRAGTYNNLGLTYYWKGCNEEAINNYTEAIKLYPDNKLFYFNRALALYAIGEYECAISDYDVALELSGDDAVIYNNRGEAFASLGNYKKAIADFNKALNINPCDAIAYGNTVIR